MEPSVAKRTKDDLYILYQRHVKTVYRVCYLYMKNPQDAEDMVQSTFLKLFQYSGEFSDAEHEKAWLIVTAAICARISLRAGGANAAFRWKSPYNVRTEGVCQTRRWKRCWRFLHSTARHCICTTMKAIPPRSWLPSCTKKKRRSAVIWHRGRALLKMEIGGNES